ncbi:MAG: A/G-specific adenine glycosylase [Planctomycetes bacterium]|nr:A/G-specific adenine glycosylase [Planctomycetota bacterium]
MPDAAWRRRFRQRLRTWYDRHARDLAWRRNRDPYRIWVSEIMLQQTQVATVGPYFERFLKSFPTIAALARADEQDVLRQWEGLGYYRRARQLHQAARILVEEHEGRFPRDGQAVRRLPGIGRYTAGAILSIAFDAREPILEANTSRLFIRLLAYRQDPATAAGQRLLWAMAQDVLPRRDVGRFNQAMMELGSQVCLPRAPRCSACPVTPLCRAFEQGAQTDIPPPKAKPPLETRHEAALIVRRRGRVLLVRCPDGGRWAGLWDFPRFQVHAQAASTRRRELVDNVLQQTGMTVEPGKHLKTLKHGVTRFRITLDCYEAEYVSGPNGKTDAARMRWLRPADLEAYPLSTTGRKLSRLLRR